jgi:hypothetical protein
VVELDLDLLDTRQTAPVWLIPWTVLEGSLGVVFRQVDVDRLGGRRPRQARTGGSGKKLIHLAVVEQPFERVHPGVAVAVPQLGEGSCSERDLAEWRRPLVDEPLQPAQRCAFVARRIGVRQ